MNESENTPRDARDPEREPSTTPTDTTEDTRVIETEQQSTTQWATAEQAPPEQPTTGWDRAEQPTSEQPASAPRRPGGPHLPAILLGLACLVIAGLALAQELGHLRVDWGNVGPLGIVAAGALLVVLGLVGLLTSRRRES
ncbi:MAG TPA: hypothetical protein VGK60_05155 [Pedococcus sp.]|jgi:hypothetical protein